MVPLEVVSLSLDPDNGARAEAAALNATYGELDAREAVELAVRESTAPGTVAAPYPEGRS